MLGANCRAVLACALSSVFLISASGSQSSQAAERNVCKFDNTALKFAGDAGTQAKCLLRPVKKGGALGPALQELPSPLAALVDKPVTVSKASLRSYLQGKTIAEADIGGSLDQPVSRAGNGGPFATYFVIHDTSTPNCSDKDSRCVKLGELPANLNDATWRYNTTSLILRYESGNPVAHVFVARTGASKTGFDFRERWNAVKLEGLVPDGRATGLFLHIENVQPRIGDPAIPAEGKKPNDLVAPNPGFSDPQYERLALVYIAASVRRGSWLIPAFHAVIDSGLRNAHDDPQNFDLKKWSDTLDTLIGHINQPR